VVDREDYLVVTSNLGVMHKAKEPVMRVDPYYSINPDDPDVYHDHDNCPSGQQIPDRNRRDGTNNYRICETCDSM
jgi:hypothetical protein